jgi:DNA-binding NtrC family response regulator
MEIAMQVKGKLLIVDDEKDIHEILEVMLTDVVTEIEHAFDGKEALEKIIAGNFHTVLSDINMPKLNGLDLLKEVRTQGHHVPFVILTAFGDKEKAVEALKLGAFDFLDKPWEEENLKDVVGRSLELGLYLDKFSKTPDALGELLEVHDENRKSSIEYLQKIIQNLAYDNQSLRKKIEQ